MKVLIEVDENITENEVVIKCNALNDQIQELQKMITMTATKKQSFMAYKGETEFYLALEDILFFETGDNGIHVHTAADIYLVKSKLYELEFILPGSFMRVSKSAILNTNKVYSVTRNLTATSIVQFQNSAKQVYVSRYYIRALKNKLEEKVGGKAL